MKNKYNIGDKFTIQIDRIYLDDDGNLLYGIKGFNSLVFDDNGLDKLTQGTSNREYAKGWNDGVNQAFQTINKQLAMLSLEKDKENE